MKKITLFISIILISECLLADTYTTLLSNKKCQESSNQLLSCSYKADKSLHVEIAGIGGASTGIAFIKSDFNGGYYGKFGLLHGCVIINNSNNFGDFAFISPKNGKIYKDWPSCQKQL